MLDLMSLPRTKETGIVDIAMMLQKICAEIGVVDEYFTGSITLHFSQGSLRDIEKREKWLHTDKGFVIKKNNSSAGNLGAEKINPE